VWANWPGPKDIARFPCLVTWKNDYLVLLDYYRVMKYSIKTKTTTELTRSVQVLEIMTTIFGRFYPLLLICIKLNILTR
jgi:hypothetical protein